MKIRIYHNPTKKIEENENSATSIRVVRGGSWGISAGAARVSRRSNARPGREYDFLGFRIVRNQK